MHACIDTYINHFSSQPFIYLSINIHTYIHTYILGSDKLFGDVIQSIRIPSLNPDATPYRADNSGMIYIYIY